MAAQWTQNELTTLSRYLNDGFPVYLMMSHIPSRTEGAILQQALRLSYSVKTFKDDGIKRFYHGVNRRSTTTENVQVSVADEAPMRHSEPATRIVPYDGFSANSLAVRMLIENNLSVDPDIIYQLSLHILKGML